MQRKKQKTDCFFLQTVEKISFRTPVSRYLKGILVEAWSYSNW